MRITSNIIKNSGISKLAKVGILGLAMIPAAQGVSALTNSEQFSKKVLPSSELVLAYNNANQLKTNKFLDNVNIKDKSNYSDLLFRPNEDKSNIVLVVDSLVPKINDYLKDTKNHIVTILEDSKARSVVDLKSDFPKNLQVVWMNIDRVIQVGIKDQGTKPNIYNQFLFEVMSKVDAEDSLAYENATDYCSVKKFYNYGAKNADSLTISSDVSVDENGVVVTRSDSFEEGDSQQHIFVRYEDYDPVTKERNIYYTEVISENDLTKAEDASDKTLMKEHAMRSHEIVPDNEKKVISEATFMAELNKLIAKNNFECFTDLDRFKSFKSFNTDKNYNSVIK